MSAQAAADAPSGRQRAAEFPLGLRVRFIESEAPRAFRRYGQKVGTVVTRNLRANEIGLTFGWSGKRTDNALRWSGKEALVWAEPRELEVVP
jgi:hypothetical protein